MTSATELRDALLAVNVEANALWSGLTEEQVSWCPAPGKWSIAQNLAHLCTTTSVFLPAVDKAIQATRDRKLHSAGPFGLKPYGRLLVWYVEPPPAVRLPAPRALRPPPLASSAAELDHFLESQSAMRQRMESVDQLNITALRFPSPLASYVRMNLLEFFAVFNGHSRRHLWQIKNIRAALPVRGTD